MPHCVIIRLQRHGRKGTVIPCLYVSIWRVSVYRRVARAEPPKAGFGPVLCVSNLRKMCVCITKASACGSGFAKRSSWQGEPAARPPLHPLRLYGASRSLIRPDNGSDRISAIHAPSGSLRRSPAGIRAYAFPHRQGACLSPLNPASPEGPTLRGLDVRHGFARGADQRGISPPLWTPSDQPSADWMPPCCLVNRNDAPTTYRWVFRHPRAANRQGTHRT